MVKRALITGVSGQIGSYLAEILLEKGYEVFGFERSENGAPKEVKILTGDLADLASLEAAIKESSPDEIYNLAALSNARISIERPEYTMKVNLLPIVRICEIALKINPEIKIFQAGSAEFYGNFSGEVDETTSFDPKNPYAVAKLAAFNFMKYLRDIKKMFCCNGIIFNSESPRRGDAFVTRKITRSAAEIKKGELDVLALGNLDSKRDWIHAKDTAMAIWTMMQQEKSDDYIISLGEEHTVRDFAEAAFEAAEINLSWEGEGIDQKGYDENGKRLVSVNPEFFRPDDRSIYGNSSKLRSLGWVPQYPFEEIVSEMVKADLEKN
jgi:GDPmannose 4,6-dehydratase